MFGLKIFVWVQTFRRVPPVLPRNFCHPGAHHNTCQELQEKRQPRWQQDDRWPPPACSGLCPSSGRPPTPQWAESVEQWLFFCHSGQFDFTCLGFHPETVGEGFRDKRVSTSRSGERDERAVEGAVVRTSEEVARARRWAGGRRCYCSYYDCEERANDGEKWL